MKNFSFMRDFNMVSSFKTFILRPSPIPCFFGCGFGPLAQVPKFKKETDTLYVGTGESQLGGGCCQPCCHNEGDKFVINEGKLE